VAFSSLANNLVPNDENGRRDVFVKNMTTGALIRIGQDVNGVEGDGDSDNPSISAAGNRVAFESSAGNLYLLDGNLISDVLVADLISRKVFRASEDSAGVAGNGGSGAASLNADGTVVAFASVATNLVASDTNAVMDVFVKNLVTGETVRASESASGAAGDGASYNPMVSGSGRFVVFWSAATNLVAGDVNGIPDAFVKDMLTGEIARLSVNFDGLEANAPSTRPAVSGDGRYAVFESFADNLVSGDLNTVLDVFVTLNPVGQ
jgi:Tol biopolymer transport system component